MRLFKWILVFSLVVGIVSVADGPTPTHAVTKAELDKINAEIKALQAKKAAAQKKAANAKAQKKAAEQKVTNYTKEIKKLQKQIESSGQQIQSLQGKINTTELTLADAQTKMNDAQARVNARDAKLKSRLKLMYMNGSVSYLEVLFSSSSFSDLIGRLSLLESLVGQDKTLLDANKEDLAIITDQKVQISNMLNSLQGDYSKMSKLRSNMMYQESVRESQVSSLKKQVEHFEEVTAQEEAAAVSLARQEAALIAKKQSMGNTITGGRLGYPLLRTYPITSNFGRRIDPITKKAGAQHNGMDFGAPSGTTIIASEAGTVVTAGWVNGYGYTVVISHGEIWTWYCHMKTGTIAVSSGQKVSRGQKVGQVGSTGRSTGPHLHFGVYNSKSDQWLDPRKYLNL
jgi:murein DD-endopeptidase MepM/ murein hydrolase activator NlpD